MTIDPKASQLLLNGQNIFNSSTTSQQQQQQQQYNIQTPPFLFKLVKNR